MLPKLLESDLLDYYWTMVTDYGKRVGEGRFQNTEVANGKMIVYVFFIQEKLFVR